MPAVVNEMKDKVEQFRLKLEVRRFPTLFQYLSFTENKYVVYF